jgi:hypothetical protein
MPDQASGSCKPAIHVARPARPAPDPARGESPLISGR